MYLITGGAGFIGSHLCEALVAQGMHVRVLDDFSTGNRSNLQTLPPGVRVIEGDVADPRTVRLAVEGITGCFHLAAIASVARGVTDWRDTHRVNLTGAVTLFEAMSRLPERPPVVYASSAAVYGAAEPPLTEETPARPLSAYGADKYGCELHARVASLVHRVPTTGLRFFNVYGPRQDPASPYSGVISIFFDRLSKGEPIDIFGDGTQTRDFVYVGDVVAAMLAAMRRLMHSVRCDAAVHNVCTGRATTILELARLIAAGRPVMMQHCPPRAGEIRHSWGSPAWLREVGVVPESLIMGLGHTREWLGV
jgi:UDP-glucose 4-epimerase